MFVTNITILKAWANDINVTRPSASKKTLVHRNNCFPIENSLLVCLVCCGPSGLLPMIKPSQNFYPLAPTSTTKTSTSRRNRSTTLKFRLLQNPMSQRETFRGPVCGTDNCTATRYFEDEDGISCIRGHLHPVSSRYFSSSSLGVYPLTKLVRNFNSAGPKTICLSKLQAKLEQGAKERNVKKSTSVSHEKKKKRIFFLM